MPPCVKTSSRPGFEPQSRPSDTAHIDHDFVLVISDIGNGFRSPPSRSLREAYVTVTALFPSCIRDNPARAARNLLSIMHAPDEKPRMVNEVSVRGEAALLRNFATMHDQAEQRTGRSPASQDAFNALRAFPTQSHCVQLAGWIYYRAAELGA